MVCLFLPGIVRSADADLAITEQSLMVTEQDDEDKGVYEGNRSSLHFKFSLQHKYQQYIWTMVTNNAEFPIKVKVVNVGTQEAYIKLKPKKWARREEKWEHRTCWKNISPAEGRWFRIPVYYFSTDVSDFAVEYSYVATALRVRAESREFRNKYSNKRILMNDAVSSGAQYKVNVTHDCELTAKRILGQELRKT